MRVIHNGFDTEKLRPDAAARREIRAELGIGPTVPLIGLVARFDPLKDHATFVAAAGAIACANADARFLLCGDNVVSANPELMTWIRRAKVEERTHLLGRREDVPRVNAALDIAVCSSSMEGMPNVVGEAMSCGVPCIVTDVGDAALLVGDTGAVVPRRDPSALASACLTWLALPADELGRKGERARNRILEEFSLPVSVGRYAELYRSVIAL
jgi:glycosyltransferase involved in cell wall biosynthesis